MLTVPTGFVSHILYLSVNVSSLCLEFQIIKEATFHGIEAVQLLLITQVDVFRWVLL